MTVVVNGADRRTSEGSTLASLVGELVTDSNGCAVAVNDEVIPRHDWLTRQLYDGDRVEILTAVQGG